MRDVPQLASGLLVLAFASVMFIVGQMYKNQPPKSSVVPFARLTAAETTIWTHRANRLP
jgi:hypothetical protein